MTTDHPSRDLTTGKGGLEDAWNLGKEFALSPSRRIVR